MRVVMRALAAFYSYPPKNFSTARYLVVVTHPEFRDADAM